MLYATIPSQALGFTISTPNAKVIDLGTEFGVKAGLRGETELHVIKGKTILISGSGTDSQAKHEVSEGQAREVASAGVVRNISLKTRGFIRRIQSETSFIWRGQPEINLADIIGGGNGLGTGRLNVGIDPASGVLRRSVRGYEREGDCEYKVVGGNQLID